MTRKLIKQGKTNNEILRRIVQDFLDFKDILEVLAEKYAKNVLDKCRRSYISKVSNHFIKYYLETDNTDINIGKYGIG